MSLNGFNPCNLCRTPTGSARFTLLILLTGFLVLVGQSGFAQTLEEPDPAEWAQMNAQQQREQRLQMQKRLENASPAEREAFRKSLRKRLQAMSPEEREELAVKARERWRAMSPQEREQFKAERSERLRSLPREERRHLIEQRRAMLDSLSPQERAALREKLPNH